MYGTNERVDLMIMKYFPCKFMKRMVRVERVFVIV